jgi:hypothetical protein
MIKNTVNVNGEEFSVYRINNDVNGNPRYLIHFLDMGLKTYEATKETRKAGFTIYRGK